MRDNFLIFLILTVVLLIAVLFVHIAHSLHTGKNWFTTPLFGNQRIMQVMLDCRKAI